MLLLNHILILNQRLNWRVNLLNLLLIHVLKEIINVLLSTRKHLVYWASRSHDIRLIDILIRYWVLLDRLIRRNNHIFVCLIIHHMSMHHVIIFLINWWLNNLLLRLSALELLKRLLTKRISLWHSWNTGSIL